jgi:hypothetical protein
MLNGEIDGWRRQHRFDLRVNGNHVTTYIIDFAVDHPDGSTEYVECKGFETDVWKLKWALLKAVFEQDFRKDEGDRLTLVKQKDWRKKIRQYLPGK